MIRKKLLFVMIIGGLLVSPGILMLSSSLVIAEDKAPLVPMELDGTEWEVEMVYVTENGKKNTTSDMLIFKGKKFISKDFESKKYSPTNYSLTALEDGSTKFGTMQVKGKDKGKETSFWKGMIKEDAMDGSVHTQFPGGKTQTTYFKGKLISGALKPKVKKPTPTPPPPPPKVKPVIPPPPPEAKPVVPEAPVVDEVVEQVQPEEVKVVDEIKAEVEAEVEAEEVKTESDEIKEEEKPEKKSGWFSKKKK